MRIVLLFVLPTTHIHTYIVCMNTTGVIPYDLVYSARNFVPILGFELGGSIIQEGETSLTSNKRKNTTPMKCATPLMVAVKSLAFMAKSPGEAEERERRSCFCV